MYETTYTYDDVEAAVCIWEWFMEPSNSRRDAWAKSDSWRGYSDARRTLIDFCEVCEQTWILAQDNGIGFDGCFDWEFVPAFMVECVDWKPAPTLKPAIYIATWAIGLRYGE